jgi:hypothetical protein
MQTFMETKLKSHGIRRIFYDILRDKNSTKYSMTKFAALVGLMLLSAVVISSLIIMWQKNEIDHVLLVELIGFVLTLLGFKNNFGIKSKTGEDIIGGGNENGGQMGDHDDLEAQKMNGIDTPTDKTNDQKG